MIDIKLLLSIAILIIVLIIIIVLIVIGIKGIKFIKKGKRTEKEIVTLIVASLAAIGTFLALLGQGPIGYIVQKLDQELPAAESEPEPTSEEPEPTSEEPEPASEEPEPASEEPEPTSEEPEPTPEDNSGTSEKEHVLPDKIPDQGKFFYNFGHTYGFYDAAVYGLEDYNKVSEFCRGQGGHLATIDNWDENEYLFEILKENYDDTAFFGYSDYRKERSWRWEYGDSTFTYWTQGDRRQPDDGANYGTTEDFAEFNYDGRKEPSYKVPNDGTWNDAPFRRNTNMFICEWEYEVEKE